METKLKTEITGNWRKYYDYRFISGEDLITDATLTIKSIGIDEVKTQKGTEDKVVVAFIETDKMIVLNKTNAKTMTKLFSTPLIENWIGKKIVLTAEKVSAFGQTVSAVRIKH